MKICILTPRFPFPENGGDVLRINNIARYLKAQHHELVLVSYCEQEPDMETAKDLYDKVYTIRRKRFDSLWYSLLFMLGGKPIQCGYYYSRGFMKLFKSVVEKEAPERYVAHLLRMSPYLERIGQTAVSVVEMTDALSKTYALSAGAKGGVIKRLIYKMEKNLIRRYERHVMRAFPKVVLVSQADIDYLRAERGVASDALELHTNGVDCVDAPSLSYDARKICFVGNMRTLQNQDAVLHFVNDIFPLILKEIPDAMFYVVGAEPPRSIRNLVNGKNVVVTGFVDDLAATLSGFCVAVAPVQVAAGIQNKVLVAMATGVPVVMTPLISKAIPELKDSENCLIREDNQAFADSCILLMKDSEVRNTIAGKGYEMVKRYYSWHEKLKGFEILR